MVVISLVTLVAVGPQKLPGMLKTMGSWARKLRKMTMDVRQQTGIDEMLRAEGIQLSELRSLMRGYHGNAAPGAPVTTARPYEDPYANIDPDPLREYPPEGADAYGALPDDLLESATATPATASAPTPTPAAVTGPVPAPVPAPVAPPAPASEPTAAPAPPPAAAPAPPPAPAPIAVPPLFAASLAAMPRPAAAPQPSAAAPRPSAAPRPAATPPPPPVRSALPPPPSRAAGTPPPPPRRSSLPPRPDPAGALSKPEVSDPNPTAAGQGTANGNG
ncbi:MAG TPA: hypothetical protein VJN18_31915 [Polyangiaceae bacterium]|nr:hypothetical protein [Polyangiaceae bacterium]